MISPIENSGMIMRTQDYSTVRQNEDNHSNNIHVHIQEQMDKTDDNKSHTVRSRDDADSSDTHHDARDEGRNKYFDTRKKKSEKVAKDGVVIAKSKNRFDISI